MSLPTLPENYPAAVRHFQIDRIQLLAEGTCDDCHELTQQPEYL